MAPYFPPGITEDEKQAIIYARLVRNLKIINENQDQLIQEFKTFVEETTDEERYELFLKLGGDPNDPDLDYNNWCMKFEDAEDLESVVISYEMHRRGYWERYVKEKKLDERKVQEYEIRTERFIQKNINPFDCCQEYHLAKGQQEISFLQLETFDPKNDRCLVIGSCHWQPKTPVPRFDYRSYRLFLDEKFSIGKKMPLVFGHRELPNIISEDVTKINSINEMWRHLKDYNNSAPTSSTQLNVCYNIAKYIEEKMDNNQCAIFTVPQFKMIYPFMRGMKHNESSNYKRKFHRIQPVSLCNYVFYGDMVCVCTNSQKHRNVDNSNSHDHIAKRVKRSKSTECGKQYYVLFDLLHNVVIFKSDTSHSPDCEMSWKESVHNGLKNIIASTFATSIPVPVIQKCLLSKFSAKKEILEELGLYKLNSTIVEGITNKLNNGAII